MQWNQHALFCTSRRFSPPLDQPSSRVAVVRTYGGTIPPRLTQHIRDDGRTGYLRNRDHGQLSQDLDVSCCWTKLTIVLHDCKRDVMRQVPIFRAIKHVACLSSGQQAVVSVEMFKTRIV